jgi:transcription elongation factor Elf1
MSQDDLKIRLQPVHVCQDCNHELSRSEMDAYALISGVVECRVCGRSGPLNIEIRPAEAKKPPRSDRET